MEANREASREAVTEVVEAAARRYARRYTDAELDDLRQEAWVAVLRAEKTWDSGRGVPFEAYSWHAAIRALYGYVSRARAPVSGSLHKLDELAKCRPARDYFGALESLATTEVLDEDVHAQRWLAAVILRTREVVLSVEDGHLAAGVLLHGKPARTVAATESAPKSRVYRATRRARRAISNDDNLRALWSDR